MHHDIRVIVKGDLHVDNLWSIFSQSDQDMVHTGELRKAEARPSTAATKWVDDCDAVP